MKSELRKRGHVFFFLVVGLQIRKWYYRKDDQLPMEILEIKDIFKVNKPDILCLTETKLKSKIRSEIISCEGYDVWRKDRVGKTGGGIIVFTRKELEVTEMQVKQTGSGSEIEAMEVMWDKKEKCIILNVYVPPLTAAWTNDKHEALNVK